MAVAIVSSRQRSLERVIEQAGFDFRHRAALVEMRLKRFGERRLLGFASEDKFFAADFAKKVVVIARRAAFLFLDSSNSKFELFPSTWLISSGAPPESASLNVITGR